MWKGKESLCNREKDIGEIMNVFMVLSAIPITKCPVQKQRFCMNATNSMSLLNCRRFVRLTAGGILKIEAVVEHENGGKSCVFCEALIKKI